MEIIADQKEVEMLYFPNTGLVEDRGSSLVSYVIVLALAVGVVAIVVSMVLSLVQALGIETIGDGIRLFLSIS